MKDGGTISWCNCGRKIKMDKAYTSCKNKNEQIYWNNVQNKAFDPTKCSLSPYLS